MLSTGVDIPDLEFIVFLRPVKSRILFEQMLGRGTRQGREASRQVALHRLRLLRRHAARILPRRVGRSRPSRPTSRPGPIKEVIDDIWNNRDRAYNVRCLVKRLQRIDKEMSGEARDRVRRVRPRWRPRRVRRRAAPSGLAGDFTGTMKLLRDEPAFQNLLVNYPRPQRGLPRRPRGQGRRSRSEVAHPRRDGQGAPAGRLPRALRANTSATTPTRSTPSASCSTGPQEWGTDALAELRRKLAATTGAIHRREPARRPTRPLSQGRSWTSSRWSSTPPTRRHRC